MSLFSELKRRNVFRTAAAYLVISWLIMQVAASLENALNLPAWFDSMVISVLLIGFPIVMLFSWAYEITPEGIKKEKDVVKDESINAVTAKKLNIITLLAVIAAGGMFAYQQLNPPTTLTVSVSETQISQAPGGDQSQTTNPQIISKITTTVTETNSIAVLPFVNMSSDKEQEYFADGISEEILNALVKAKGLRVVGRTSSFSFKGKDDTIKDIGSTLNVAHVLEGSVRKQGNQVRITAQLIRADDESHLWSESYNGTLDNIFDLQEKISRQVTSELKVILDLGSDERLANNLTDNIDAYDLFLRGREAVSQRVHGKLEEGMELLRQALKLDPNFAEAWAVLGEAEGVSIGYISLSAEEQQAATRRSKEYAHKALALNKQLALPHAVLGGASVDEGNTLQAIDEFNQALAIEPNNTLAIRWLANAYAGIGRLDLAFPLHQKVYQLEPLSTVNAFNLAAGHFKQNNPDEAIRFFRITGDLRGNKMIQTADIYSYQGKHDLAKDYVRELIAEQRSKVPADKIISDDDLEVYLQAIFGGTEQEKAKARELRALIYNGANVRSPWQIYELAALSDFDRVFEIFEQQPAFFAPYAADYLWLPTAHAKALRADPRFPKLLEKHKVPEVWRAIGSPEQCKPNAGTDGSNGQFSCQ